MKAINTAIASRLGAATALTNLLANLQGGTTPAIIQGKAPEGQAYPYVVYSLQSGIDENMTANRTKSMLYFVRGYSKVSNAQAGSIDAAIDTALHLVPFTGVSGWTNFWMAREQDIELVENPPTGGQVFTNGGVYRCRIDKD